jgi:methyl-accepting chemotaxis protein
MKLDFKRRRFLINPRFQYRFAFYLCTWVLAVAAIFPVLLNQTFTLLTQQLISSPGGPEVAYILEARTELMKGIYQLVAVFMVAIAGISIFISHRIVGPLYKLNEYFKEAARTGVLKSGLRFRATDHFSELAENYNAMVEAVSRKSSS